MSDKHDYSPAVVVVDTHDCSRVVVVVVVVDTHDCPPVVAVVVDTHDCPPVVVVISNHVRFFDVFSWRLFWKTSSCSHDTELYTC